MLYFLDNRIKQYRGGSIRKQRLGFFFFFYDVGINILIFSSVCILLDKNFDVNFSQINTQSNFTKIQSYANYVVSVEIRFKKFFSVNTHASNSPSRVVEIKRIFRMIKLKYYKFSRRYKHRVEEFLYMIVIGKVGYHHLNWRWDNHEN